MTTLLKTEIGDAIQIIEWWPKKTTVKYVQDSKWDRLLLFFDKCLKRK
jgi:hypothetical protein